jgi:hypothetical protein
MRGFLDKARQVHDYWTSLSALGRAAIDYTAAIAKAHDAGVPPGSDAVIDSLQALAHLSISFTVQVAIDLGYDVTKLRELERALIAELTEAAQETS